MRLTLGEEFQDSERAHKLISGFEMVRNLARRFHDRRLSALAQRVYEMLT